MIGTLEQSAFDQPPLRQWHAFVATPLVEGDDFAFKGPPHDQRFFRNDLTLQLLRGEFPRQPGHVPGILYQHVSSHHLGPRNTMFSMIFQMCCMSIFSQSDDSRCPHFPNESDSNPLRQFVGRPMIAHISIGVRDIDSSKRFYDSVLEPLGYKCIRAARTLSGYGYGRDTIAFWVVSAERPVPADEESGLHICFAAPNTVR
jgi:hypothetical protein